MIGVGEGEGEGILCLLDEFAVLNKEVVWQSRPSSLFGSPTLVALRYKLDHCSLWSDMFKGKDR